MLKQYFLDIMRKECNGLYLCEVPTGIGKSYQAAHAMEEYVKEIRWGVCCTVVAFPRDI